MQTPKNMSLEPYDLQTAISETPPYVKPLTLRENLTYSQIINVCMLEEWDK